MEFETFCLDMANQFEPGKFDVMKEIMPNYEPPASSAQGGQIDLEEYPLTCTTGRRIPVYFHSEHRQLPWCRELWPVPRVESSTPPTAEKLGLEQGDWAWIETPWGKVRQCVDLYYGIDRPAASTPSTPGGIPSCQAPATASSSPGIQLHSGPQRPGQVSSGLAPMRGLPGQDLQGHARELARSATPFPARRRTAPRSSATPATRA